MATFTEEATASDTRMGLAIDNIKRGIALLQIENERLRAANVEADVTARALRYVLEFQVTGQCTDGGHRLESQVAHPLMPPDVARCVHGVLTMIELEAECAG